MASVKRFEDLNVWNAATDLAVHVFKLTEAQSFRFKGDLVNQLRRAALSVPNNIAEGFERGSTSELITFLYIARGSAGEVRSMLRFSLRLGEMPDEAGAIESLIVESESVARMLYRWLDALKNGDIEGQRRLDDHTRAIYGEKKRQESFNERLVAWRTTMEQQLADGVFGKPDAPPLPTLFPSAKPMESGNEKPVETAVAEDKADADGAPKCPVCGRTMLRRHTREGKPFWGCTAFPKCKGSRNA